MFGDEKRYPSKSIAEVANICRGASPRPISDYLTEDVNGVNWIKIGDISIDDIYVTHTAEKITKEGAKKSRYVTPGDFILSNFMSFGRPYILGIEGCLPVFLMLCHVLAGTNTASPLHIRCSQFRLCGQFPVMTIAFPFSTRMS